MMLPFRSIASLVVVALALAVLPRTVRAQGSPPLNTNDPVVVGARALEVNLGFAVSQSASSRDREGPILDANYGINPTMQISFNLPWLQTSPSGGRSESGPGKSTLGLKWLLVDRASGGVALSVHPQWAFDPPGSSSARRGLVDDGSSLALPVQCQTGWADWTFTAEAGHVLNRKRANEWFFGISAGRDFSSNLTLGLELFCETANRFDRSALLLNAAGSWKVSERYSVLFALGRELHRHDADPARVTGYVGWQIRL